MYVVRAGKVGFTVYRFLTLSNGAVKYKQVNDHEIMSHKKAEDLCKDLNEDLESFSKLKLVKS